MVRKYFNCDFELLLWALNLVVQLQGKQSEYPFSFTVKNINRRKNVKYLRGWIQDLTIALWSASPQYRENTSNASSSASVNTPSNLFTICTTPITLFKESTVIYAST